MNRLSRCTLAIALLLFGACARGAGPEEVAKQFQQLAIAGDLIPLYGLVSALDTAAIGRKAFTDSAEVVGISTAGFPSTVLDSAKTKTSEGDAAVIDVYMTGPNWEQALGAFMGAAFSGDTSKASLAAMAAKMPRITHLVELHLVRDRGNWKVRLYVPERRELARLALAMREGYLDVPLQERAPAARQYLEAATRLPALAGDEGIAEAKEIVAGSAYVDSLAFDLNVEKTWIYRGERANLHSRGQTNRLESLGD